MLFISLFRSAGCFKRRVASISLLLFLRSLTIQAQSEQSEPNVPVKELAKAFKTLLQRPTVAFKPYFETIKTDSVVIQKGYIYSEKTEKVPILIYKPVVPSAKSFPVVICLHGTGGNKEQADIRNLLYRFSQRGIIAVAIDARYHGARIEDSSPGSQAYIKAIISAWEEKDKARQQQPFLYDTVYDLWRLTDYLMTRPDVQKNRLAMTGISMGGIQTWLAASVDTRIKVAVPIIAAQSFKWSLTHDQWQGRARTIWAAHEKAAQDLGDTTVNSENVKILWEKLVPGITNQFDCPSLVRLFAPRPLLLLSNEKDQNCPLPEHSLFLKRQPSPIKLSRQLIN